MTTDNLRLHKTRILAGCFLGVACGYSSAYFYSSGLLLVAIGHDLHLSRGQATLALFTCSATAAVMAPFLGRAVDRFGARPVGLASMVGLAISFLICAGVTRGLASLLVTSALIALLGAGSSSIPFSRLVVDEFDRRRGLALAVMQAGAGLGAFAIPFLLSSSLRDDNWRGAYHLLASVVVIAALAVAALLGRSAETRNRPMRSAVMDGAGLEVWTSLPFLILAGTFLLAANAIAAAVVHFVPMMIDKGVAPGRAGHLASTLGIALIVGRLGTGWLLDRLMPEYVAAALFMITAFGLSVLALAGPDVALMGALIVGLAIGSEVDLLSFLTARHFPRERYGTAYGGAFGLFLFGSAVGPLVMGWLYDRDGDYRMGFLLAAASLVGAAVLAAALRRFCPTDARHEAAVVRPAAAR